MVQAANIDVPCDTAALIAAIVAANATPEADTLNLAAGCPYILTAEYNSSGTGLPPITGEITIMGSGAAIERDDLAPEFGILGVEADGNLTLDAVSVRNGSGVSGAGIWNRGTLTLLNGSNVSDNNAGRGRGGGINNTGGTVTVVDSAITGNHSEHWEGGSDGGGIHNTGEVLLINSVVSGNVVDPDYGSGGGIDNAGGTMTLIDSTVTGNMAGGGGGGIYNSAVITLTSSTVSNNLARTGGGIYSEGALILGDNTAIVTNTAAWSGGGIANAGVMTVTGSTVNGNHALEWGPSGGGIDNSGTAMLINITLRDNEVGDSGTGAGIHNSRTMRILSSTISNNLARDGGHGGGIYNRGTLALTNSTVSDNEAYTDGGGIYNLGTLTLANSTVSDNEADYTHGGGIYSMDDGAVELVNTIVGGNTADDGGNCWGTIISKGYNLDSDGTCGLDPARGDLPGTDPMLGPLRDNGGPTWTHALSPGSPAIDQGSCHSVTTDQRGKPRPVDILNIANADDGCDIGAFEYQPGKIVVNNDEWPLSNEGFPPDQDTDAAQFARNVASWFTGGEPGDFLVYSVPFGLNTGLVGAKLADTMTAADHSWTISSTIPFSLSNILKYDAIFVAGTPAHGLIPPNNDVLIEYVRSGGNVYLAGGTDLADPRGEATQWNPFLRACGLDFAPVDHQNDLDGVLKFDSAHPIFAGVQRLFQRDGNFIRDLDPWDPSGAILVRSEQGVGLYAVCTIGAAIESAPTAIDLLSFTAEAAADHVTLAWETGTEVDNAGFNLHRATAADGPYTKLNDALIPAEGDPHSGASYSYTDTDVVKGVTYYYKLEDVDIHGASAFHGPVSATPGRIHLVYLPLMLK